MWEVYEIKTEDGRVYVGCTSMTLEKRVAAHRRRGAEFALKEHTVKLLFSTTSKSAGFRKEAEYIKSMNLYDPRFGYNKSMKRKLSGSSNPMFGRKHSSETKEKIRQKALARDSSTFENVRHKTSEQIEKLQKGRAKYQKKYGYPMTGRTHSPEARKKMSEAVKRRYKVLGY